MYDDGIADLPLERRPTGEPSRLYHERPQGHQTLSGATCESALVKVENDCRSAILDEKEPVHVFAAKIRDIPKRNCWIEAEKHGAKSGKYSAMAGFVCTLSTYLPNVLSEIHCLFAAIANKKREKERLVS